MSTIKITQSLIKNLYLVAKDDPEECGLVFEAKFIHGLNIFETTKAQRLGQWFEYKCTGARPKHGKVPDAIKTKAGGLTKSYAIMEKHVDNFKRFMQYNGLEIVSVGRKITVDDLEGTLDVEARCKTDLRLNNKGPVIAKAGDIVIIDIKATAMFDDKFNNFGWHNSTLPKREMIMTQAVHYKFIGSYPAVYGKSVPFIFLVFNTKNAKEYKAVHAQVTDEATKNHIQKIQGTIKILGGYIQNGFPALPSLQRCGSCPLKQTCKHYMPVAEIVNVMAEI